MSISYETQQDWGRISIRLSGKHYYHDLSKYEISFNTSMRFRITKGLSLNPSFYGSLIRNQLNLPAGGASVEDLLLQQRTFASGYNYGINLSISYSFGALNNNIVNPRLF